MQDSNIVFHNSIFRLRIKPNSLSQSIPSCKPKHTTSSNNRHFSDVFHCRVPPKNTQGAPFVNPFYEGIIHDHEQSKVVLRGEGVDSLSSSDELGAQLGALGQRVVRHEGGSERSGSLWANDFHGTGVFAIQDVMEVVVKVSYFLHALCG